MSPLNRGVDNNTDTAIPITTNMAKTTRDANSTVSASLRKQMLVCLFYGCTSVSITFFNKAVFSVYEFRYPCILTLLQISFCIAALTTASTLKLYVCDMRFVFWLLTD